MWRRKPDESTPAAIFLYLVTALLFGLVLWKSPSHSLLHKVTFLYIIGLVLSAGIMLLRWFLAKKREKEAAAAAAEAGEALSGEMSSSEPPPTLRRRLARCIFWAVVSAGILIYLCRDLMQGWYNNAVYRTLFLLVALLVTVNRYKQYKKARDEWKEE